jgi:hypothetical protein
MPTTSTRAGRWVRQQAGAEGFSAFVPAPLPPSPPLKFSPELQRLSEASGRALGRLEGVSASLEPDRLLYMYIRKEAVLSSAIEGTQSTLSDLLRFEAEGAPETRSTTSGRCPVTWRHFSTASGASDRARSLCRSG